MNTKDGYSKKSLTNIRLLLAGGGDIAIRQDNTAYIPETNMTVRNVTNSDFTIAVVNSFTNDGSLDIITLKDSSNNVISTLPNHNSIYRVTTTSDNPIFTSHPSSRLVFKFGTQLVSAINSGQVNDNGENNKWLYLDGFPLLPQVNYYFKFSTANNLKYAYYLGTDVKFLSSTVTGGGGTTYARLTNEAHASGTNYVIQGSGYSGTGNGSKFLREDGTWQTINAVSAPNSDITLSTSSQTYITVGGTTRKIKLPSSCPWTVGSTTLSGLSDTTISSPSSGQYLKYNGSKWVNSTMSVGSTTLSGLTDTTISSPSTGEVLKYDGSAWINGTVTATMSMVTSWADHGGTTVGASIPTLTCSKDFLGNGKVVRIPDAMFVPGEQGRYICVPVIQDSKGKLMVAIPTSFAAECGQAQWDELK